MVQANLYISGDSLRVVEDRAGISTDDGQVGIRLPIDSASQ